MFGSLFRLGMLATLVGGSTVALVGTDRLKMYYDSGKESIVSAIDEAQGMETKLTMIRSQVANLDQETSDLKEDAVRRNVEVEALRADIAERETSLAKQAQVLDKVSKLLEEGKANYRIGHVTFSRETIEVDAAEKLALYNVQTETMKSLRETLSTKEKAQAIAEQNVGRAAALRAELETKIGLLEARLQKFRAKQNFAATIDEVMDTDELDSDLARAREMIQSFEKDLEIQDRMLDERIKMGADQPADGIDYEALEQAPEDLVGQIHRALGIADGVAVTVVLDDVAVH